VSYEIGFDGVVTAELEQLLQFVENRVNSIGIHAQASEASLTASGSPSTPCPNGPPCPSSEKGGQDIVVVILVAIVAGAAAGFLAGKLACRRRQFSEKGGQD
jgi:hypothetical protein